MEIATCLLPKCAPTSGLGPVGSCCPKVTFWSLRCKKIRPVDFCHVEIIPRKTTTKRIQYMRTKCLNVKQTATKGSNNHDLSIDGEHREEQFWIKLIKEAFRAVKYLFEFLVEQPSQLKYIEWPSFHSTLKTATLTLTIVALLMVALSSVDSALSYLLVSLLRRNR